MELTYATAMTADVTDLARVLGIGVATADVDPQERARKLAQNHGFLKGLMMRVGKHFQAAGSGAVRILKSGGVWFGLLSACVSAIMFLFEARNLRHFKQQPTLGKLRVLSVGAAFGAFIMTFLGFFKKIAMAWKNESEDDLEKRRAAELLSRLDNAERAALMARTQSAHAIAGSNMYKNSTVASSVLASVLEAEGGSVAVAWWGIQRKDTDEQIAKAKAVLTKAFAMGLDAAERLARKALDLAAKHPKKVFYALIIALFYNYVATSSAQKHTANQLARDPDTLKRAKQIFETLQRNRANVSPAVYTEVQKATKAINKALVAV